MKQKRSRVLIVLGIISLVLIVGCGRDGDASGGAPTAPFLGGSQGLEIKFLQGNPPDEITDGDGTTATFPFKVIVTLRNAGEYDELTGKEVNISLAGFLWSDFLVGSDFVEGDLEDQAPDDGTAVEITARKKDSEGNILEATEVYKTFPKTDKDFKFKRQLHGNTPFVFKANVCYKYQTKAASEICFLENLVDVANDAICDPSESKTIFSSGSPIRVDSFRQSVAGKNTIQFSFDIVHSGSGDVFDVRGNDGTAGDDVYCPTASRDRRTKEDKVNVNVNTGITSGNLKCSGFDVETDGDTSFTTILVNGKRTIACTQSLTSASDFIAPVIIKLNFNYLDSIQKEVLVKHLVS